MARPHAYTRRFSFSQFETHNPGQPKPGVQLDTELDDLSRAIGGTQAALALLQRDDGKLANGIVGADQLVPGLFDDIAEAVITAAAVEANRAANYAQAAARSAASSLTAASAVEAPSALLLAATVSETEQEIAQTAAFDAEQSAMQAAESALQAAQSANDTAGAVAETEANVELSYKWAEYLAGPVAPAPVSGPGGTPYPEAVDDGMWSSKWWALRAADLVGRFGSMYLGAWGTPPLVGNAGQPLSPGMFYYQYPPGILLIWDGVRWEPFTTPTPAVQATYVYQAAAGQTEFSGLDQFGSLLIYDQDFPETTDVHVNGVRLVNARGTAFGDFDVDTVNGVVTILDPDGLVANSVVQIDLLMPKERLVPVISTVSIDKLEDISSTFDGIAVAFPIRNITDGTPITVATPMELSISLDGVMQEPAVDYTVSGSTVTFATPPPAGTRFWAVRYQP